MKAIVPGRNWRNANKQIWPTSNIVARNHGERNAVGIDHLRSYYLLWLERFSRRMVHWPGMASSNFYLVRRVKYSRIGAIFHCAGHTAEQCWFGPDYFSHLDIRCFACLRVVDRPSSIDCSPQAIPSSNVRRRCNVSNVSTSTRYADGTPCCVIRIGSRSFSSWFRISAAWRLSVVTSSVRIE